MTERPWCVRCKEDRFPIAQEPVGWAMGILRPLSKAPRWIKQRYRTEWDDPDYLCGNCYFDLLDERD